MLDNEQRRGRDAISFGPFRLRPADRLLERAGTPLHLGDRALDVLINLLERPGQVISKTELIERVWPGVTVDEGALRVHIGSLRKVLGDGRSWRTIRDYRRGTRLLLYSANLSFERTGAA